MISVCKCGPHLLLRMAGELDATDDPGLARLFHLHSSLEEALAEIDTDGAIA